MGDVQNPSARGSNLVQGVQGRHEGNHGKKQRSENLSTQQWSSEDLCTKGLREGGTSVAIVHAKRGPQDHCQIC